MGIKYYKISLIAVAFFYAQSCISSTITQEHFFTLDNTLNVSERYDQGNTLSGSNSETASFAFNSFNSSLGVLNSVNISYSSQYTHSSTVHAYDVVREVYHPSKSNWGFSTSDYLDTVTVNATVNANLSIELLNSLAPAVFASDSNTNSCTQGPITYVWIYTGCRVTDEGTSTDFSGSIDLSLEDLSMFESIAPIDIQLLNTATVFGDCTYNSGAEYSCNVYDDISWTGSLSVTYEYTSAVPVPAAVWLFGSGLLGLIGIARRKTA